MKRLFTITIMLILGCFSAAGQLNLHVKYGVEWGYNATFMDKYHSVYFDPDVGYRIDAEGTKFYIYSNGYVSARASVEFFNHYSATVLVGYCGVKQGRRIFPYTLRATYFIDSYDVNGYFAFLEGGGGFHYSSDPEIKSVYEIRIGKIGGGYRLKMSKKSSLDFMASAQLIKDHPGIYNPDIPGYIPDFYVRVSDDLFASINLSLALTF